jgi:hypothetical protein
MHAERHRAVIFKHMLFVVTVIPIEIQASLFVSEQSFLEVVVTLKSELFTIVLCDTCQ